MSEPTAAPALELQALSDPPYVIVSVPWVNESPGVERFLTPREAPTLGCKLIACAEALIEEGCPE